MFTILDKNGVAVATYANRSEAETYWRASVTNGAPKFDETVRDGEVTVFDGENKEVGAIRLPRG